MQMFDAKKVKADDLANRNPMPRAVYGADKRKTIMRRYVTNVCTEGSRKCRSRRAPVL
jgi:hypothetical protein